MATRKSVSALCVSFVLALLTVRAGAQTALLELEDAFAKVAETAVPAVVVITNKQVDRRSDMYEQLPPQFRYFFGLPDAPQPGGPQGPGAREGGKSLPVPVGGGSGVVIDAEGYVLTNYHVVKDHDALEVKLHDGRVFDSARNAEEVEVVGVDRETDLALLKVGNGELEPLPYLEFADSEAVRVGQWAIAVGAPFSLDYSISVGVVSQKGRYDLNMNTYENYIQTDASINPGNSGGPLLDVHGRVIGINDFIVTGGGMSRGSVGVGFAISSNLARQVVEDLREHGKVVRPWLGVAMQELTSELREQFGVDQGVLVSQVLEGDPAEKAGIKSGDVIVRIGDREVRTPHDLQFAILSYDPGDYIEMHLVRDGKEKTIKVQVREKNGDRTVSSGIGTRDDILNQLGLALQDVEEGVIVTGVVGGSPADLASIRRGDLVLEVNRRDVESVNDVLESLSKTRRGTALFYLDRRGERFYVPVSLVRDSEE
jgi:serine protease Do